MEIYLFQLLQFLIMDLLLEYSDKNLLEVGMKE